MNWASLSHLCGLTGPWWAPPRLVLSEGGQIKNNRIHLSIQQLTHPHKHPNEKSRRSETYRWPPPSLSLFENLLARGPHVSTASLTKQAREERGTNHHIGAQQQCSCQSPSTKLRQRTVELSQLTVPPTPTGETERERQRDREREGERQREGTSGASNMDYWGFVR